MTRDLASVGHGLAHWVPDLGDLSLALVTRATLFARQRRVAALGVGPSAAGIAIRSQVAPFRAAEVSVAQRAAKIGGPTA